MGDALGFAAAGLAVRGIGRGGGVTARGRRRGRGVGGGRREIAGGDALTGFEDGGGRETGFFDAGGFGLTDSEKDRHGAELELAEVGDHTGNLSIVFGLVKVFVWFF
ncbi:MAG: hypothetical protein ACREJO_17895 [Phycisphaerales bacterium]